MQCLYVSKIKRLEWDIPVVSPAYPLDKQQKFLYMLKSEQRAFGLQLRDKILCASYP